MKILAKWHACSRRKGLNLPLKIFLVSGPVCYRDFRRRNRPQDAIEHYAIIFMGKILVEDFVDPFEKKNALKCLYKPRHLNIWFLFEEYVFSDHLVGFLRHICVG